LLPGMQRHDPQPGRLLALAARYAEPAQASQ